MRKAVDDSLTCSFCHKSQNRVGKLISSPSDYPRAYICDECIGVCVAILEDDKEEHQSADAAALEPHPLLSHPLATELMDCVVHWTIQDSLNPPAFEALDKLRLVAARIVQDRT